MDNTFLTIYEGNHTTLDYNRFLFIRTFYYVSNTLFWENLACDCFVVDFNVYLDEKLWRTVESYFVYVTNGSQYDKDAISIGKYVYG